MNSELIKFIEICLIDGVISDKEKEVIFRKSEELGVPKDECEIILEGMMIQKNNDNVKPESLSNINEQDESKSKDSAKPTLLDDKQIEEILNLDYEILSDFTEYLKNVDKELKKAYCSKTYNKNFQKWYKKLPKHLEVVKSEYKSAYGKEKFEVRHKGINLHWTDKNGNKNHFNPDIIGFSLPEQLNLRFNFPGSEKFIGLGKSHSNNLLTVFTTSYIYNGYVKKGGFFSSDQFLYGDELRKKISDIDITEFNNKDYINRLYFLIRCFDNDESIFDSLLTSVNSFEINFNSKNGLSFLPKEIKFGDELVVKLTNYIQNLTTEYISFIKGIKYENIIPYCDLTFGKRGENPKLPKIISINLFKIQTISSLIKMRNQLLVAVLTDDRSTVLLMKEKMDDLGIMINNYQKQKLEKMDETINVLKKGFSQVTGYLSEISSNIQSVNQTISNKFDDINSTLKFNTFLNLINTYQTYKINKNTKSLK